MSIRHTSRLKWFLPLLTSRRGLVVVGVVIAAVGLLMVGRNGGSYHFGKTQVTTGLEALAAAYDGHRPIKARLSGLRYAPFISRRGESHDYNQVTRDLAEKLLLEADAEESTAASRQALGQFHLMSGSPAKAIVNFEQALKQDPDNSSLHNDYGAALLEMSDAVLPDGNTVNTLHYLARSLEQIEIGLRLKPTNVEALHNRALVLDHLKLPEQRNKAWQAYLAVETDPSWSAEARHTLDSIAQLDSPPLNSSEMLDRFVTAALAEDGQRSWHELTQNKEMITQTFIPQQLARSFLSASATGNRDEANKFLTALRYAGKLEIENAHDPFVADLANYYAHTSREQQKTLAGAYTRLDSGYAAAMKGDYDQTPFVDAQALFVRAGDVPEAKICDYWIAYCLSQKDQLGKSTELLHSLADFATSKQYRWLETQAGCWIANNYTDQGEYSKSLETYDRALATATDIGDVYNQQKILSQSGNVYLRLNQPDRALQYDWRALALVDPVSSSLRQTWRIYLYTARALIALNLLDAATEFEEEMLGLALNDIRDPAITHYSYLYLGQIQGGKKNFPEAIQFASESLRLADSLSDAENRQKLRNGALMLLGQLQRQSGEVDQALSTYNEVIENARNKELQLDKLDAYKGRLLCYVALKDSANLEAQLPQVLEDFEASRARIVEEQNRNTFFDLQQSVYDVAINLAYEKQDYVRALNYSEQSRARSLLQALTSRNNAGTQAATVVSASDIQRQLPADLQVLQFAVLDDKLVAWLITSTSIVCRAKEISGEQLRSLVSEYVKGVSAGPSDSRQAEKLRPLAQQLYSALIEPFAPDLDPHKVLCIIPDKALSYLPFAALVSPVSQRYLVTEFLLLTSPSLNVLEQLTGPSAAASSQRESLLAIGNPAFDRREYPDLDDLPAAAREATGIASKYPNSYRLIGRDAVKPAIEKRLATADVIHFAGHYVINQTDALQSKLILAKSATPPNSDLTIRELLNLRLPRAKLVVLSACETTGKDYYKGEGLVGIARAFLELGVPLVVASQWSVESESTAELMLRFHEFRRSGQSTIEALHNAQLAMLNDQNGTFRDPYYWAAFTPLGGYVQF
jgi:CHAT domain-containing protein/Tfp pilus assembly protein PilF